MKRRIIECLATGLYLGKIPRAPGTWGTLLGIPVAFLFTLVSPIGYMFGALFLVVVASYVADLHEAWTKSHDPKEIVIDEVVGYVIAMTWLPVTWQSFAYAFVLFRFFDILKPFPINYIDRRIQGGLGTVLDDVAAGLVSNVILQVVFTKTDWLGVQLVAGP